jgi:hypothetical protein
MNVSPSLNDNSLIKALQEHDQRSTDLEYTLGRS